MPCKNCGISGHDNCWKIPKEHSILGRKDDSGKPDMTYLNYDVMASYVGVLSYGGKTYGRGNYKNVEDYERIYCNAHTHGIEPHLHIDDGDFTMIYYPRMDWKKEWGGGTLVDNILVSYASNKLVVFTASLPHMAMPVSRECYELRTNVVFKCFKQENKSDWW